MILIITPDFWLVGISILAKQGYRSKTEFISLTEFRNQRSKFGKAEVAGNLGTCSGKERAVKENTCRNFKSWLSNKL